jgi:PAS domain S-box-containing protein
MATADSADQVPSGVFEALHQIGVAIGGVLEPLGLARLVAEHARALLSADAVGLWVNDEQSNSLKPLHLEHWVHPVPLAQTHADPAGVVAVPLRVDGHAIGVLGVGFPEPQQATPAAIRTLTLLAAEVGPALEAARLYEAMRTELADRRRAEASLRFQAQLLDAVEHALIAINLDGTIRYWNRAAEALYGWRSDEVLGRKVRELLVPDGLSAQGDEIRAQLAAGQSWTGEFPVRRRDGTVFQALVSDSPVRDADGRLIGMIGASIDLSERVESSRRLEESEQRFRSLFEHHPDAVFAFDPNGRVILANAGCERLSGYSPAEILAEQRAYAPPEELERGLAFFKAALRGEPQQFESVLVRKDGERLEVWTMQIPIVIDGKVVGVFGIARDITERVRAEQERESLLQALGTAQANVQELITRVLRPEIHLARSERRADLEARLASLTPRELDVLQQIAAGKTNPEIGQALGLSPKAARNRVAHVLAKLGVPDRTQAAVLAVELGLAPSA